MIEKLKSISLTNWIMIAMVAGLIAGPLIGPAIAPVGILGDIFIRLIQMSVVVMIFGAVIEAVGSLDPADLGKLGLKIFFWFGSFTILGSVIGAIFGIIFKPGEGVTVPIPEASFAAGTEMTLADTILGFFPSNVVQSLADGNMIQVIVFAITFGLAIGFVLLKNPNNQILSIVKDFNEVIAQVISIVMYTAPIGIFALIAEVTGVNGADVILPLGKFLLVFLAAAIVHMIFVILITATKTRVNPLKLVKKLKNMTIIAVTTTSSSAALPQKMEDTHNLMGVSQRINGLVNPLGTAINSNGLSMFLTIAVVFLSQLHGLDMTIGELIMAVALSSLATLGTVTVPGGGIVALTVVIPFLGLPTASIALLAGIDWFSGMIRTPLNTDVDSLVTLIVAEGEEGEFDREVFETTS